MKKNNILDSRSFSVNCIGTDKKFQSNSNSLPLTKTDVLAENEVII